MAPRLHFLLIDPPALHKDASTGAAVPSRADSIDHTGAAVTIIKHTEAAVTIWQSGAALWLSYSQ